MVANGASASEMGVKRALRLLAERVPGALALAGDGAPLELTTSSGERPRVASATVLEGTTIRAHGIRTRVRSGFVAFLDGIQRSEVLFYLPGGIPVVVGSVAAVVQERRDRRLKAWRRALAHRLYLPFSLAPAVPREATLLNIECVDISEPLVKEQPGRVHPHELLTQAVHFVQADREQLEAMLAGSWIREREGALFVDGGIGGDLTLARDPTAVGVVKSHRTLYADGEALSVVLALGEGERSSVVRIEGRRRQSVASWYLRLRDPRGRDPMWGLVRVEVADQPGAVSRADEVSSWILAETSPLALPDARWDKMAYGVRACEVYLRSIR